MLAVDEKEARRAYSRLKSDYERSVAAQAGPVEWGELAYVATIDDTIVDYAPTKRALLKRLAKAKISQKKVKIFKARVRVKPSL